MREGTNAANPPIVQAEVDVATKVPTQVATEAASVAATGADVSVGVKEEVKRSNARETLVDKQAIVNMSQQYK